MTTRAAILCGGRGERLKPLTDYYQKTMIPIGPKKLPLLAYIIAMMRHHRVTDVTLLTGYKSEDIQRYFGDGSNHGVRISYSEDPKGLKGSLNAMANALGNGSIPGSEEVLVYYGDMLSDLEITELIGVHRAQAADATLVLDKGYSLPVGVADVKDGLVTSFREKPKVDFSVTTGVMVVGPKGVEVMRRVAGPKKTDLMTDFVPALLSEGGRVAAFYTRKEWYDVGTLARFEKLNDELGRHRLSYQI